ncbi:MAG: SEFIR domain-containing protein [Candidatus Angelobacter sp.]
MHYFRSAEGPSRSAAERAQSFPVLKTALSRLQSAQSMPPERPPKVFISYSHDSPEHEQSVLAFADRLVDDGIDVILDQYVSPPPRLMKRH